MSFKNVNFKEMSVLIHSIDSPELWNFLAGCVQKQTGVKLKLDQNNIITN
jgi:hypothetical protein